MYLGTIPFLKFLSYPLFIPPSLPSFLLLLLFFTCVCVQFAVVRLFGGVEMLLDQERARHLAGGSGGRRRG